MAARPRRDSPGPVMRLAPTRRRRQMSWVVLGLLITAVCALVGGWAWLTYAQNRAVLVLTHDVPAGHILVSSDLVTQHISGDGVTSIDASDETSVLGKPAAVPLSAGTLLVRGQVGKQSGVTTTDAVIAALVKPGQYPPALAPGDRVELVLAPTNGAATLPAPSDGGATSFTPLIGTVIAVDPVPAGSGSGTVVTLRVPGERASEAARSAASGSLSLVLRPAGG